MREMKDSGIEWIGDIPKNWNMSKIGSLYTQRNEKVSDKEYQPLSVTMQGVLPQLASAAKTDDGDNRKLVRVGDFAINSRSDRRGSCGISPLDGSVSLINIILTPRTTMHPGYYDWLFHTTLFADEFYKWGHGIVADLWTTRWQEMKSICVPVPEYAEQKRISEFLNSECAEIDAVLEKTRASIDEYKKLKQTVITQAVTKGIRGGRPMKDSGIKWIGEIPADWKTAAIKRGFTLVAGATPKSEISEYWDGEICWITPADYKTEDYYIHCGRRCISKAGLESCATQIIPKNCIIFSKRAPIGSVAITANQLCTNQGCIALIPCVNVDIRYYYFALSAFTEQFNLLGSGTTFKEISASNFADFKLPHLSIEEQKEIADYLDAKCFEINNLISKKQQYLTEIENYKKSLIYEYVTGKKEVI